MAETEPGERRAASPELDREPDRERGTGPGTEREREPDREWDRELDRELDREPDREGGTGPDTERDRERNIRPGTGPGTAEAPQRPPFSYAALLAMATRASPEQRLPLSGIHACIAERFPFYRGRGRRWQSSVRLSLNPCFRRLPRGHGRAGDWALDPACQDVFPGGNHLRLRRRRRSASDPPRPGICPGPAALWHWPPSGMPSPPSGIRPGPAVPRAPTPSVLPPRPAALWPSPPSGIRPDPAAPRPPPLLGMPPVPGCPQGPWAALVLPRGSPPSWPRP